MSVFDLRQWLADADRAGELEHVRGADAALEIGTASQLNYRRKRPRALLFDEITGYQPGQRVLTSSLSSPALMGLTFRLGAAARHRHHALHLGSRVDPLGQPGQPTYNSRALIDACRPHERLADFPPVAAASDDLLRRAAQRWPELAR